MVEHYVTAVAMERSGRWFQYRTGRQRLKSLGFSRSLMAMDL